MVMGVVVTPLRLMLCLSVITAIPGDVSQQEESVRGPSDIRTETRDRERDLESEYLAGLRERQRERGENDGVEEMTPRDIGKKLIVTTRLEAPYMSLKQEVQFVAGNDRFEGYLADILEKLAESIGFDYEIRLTSDGRHGSLNPVGVWDGMIGEIDRGEADIAAGSLAITTQRSRVVEFTESFMTLRSSALLHKPRRRGQGGTRSRIKTAADLQRSNLTYGVIQGGESQYFLQYSSDQAYRGMWSQLVTFWPTGFVYSLEEGVERVRTQDYAFILDSPMAEYLANRKPCDLYTSEPFLDARKYAFAMRKGDRLRAVIDAELRRLRQEGAMQSMFLRWWDSECTSKSNTARPLTTTHSPWRHATAAHASGTSPPTGHRTILLYWLPLAVKIYILIR